MERGRGRHRRGGGGGGRRPFRGRGSGGDRDYSHRRHRGTAREQTGPPEVDREKDVDDTGEVQRESEEQSSGFSKRKILSNWDRYEATEKEPENEVLQRGTDYNVLLTSAGDAFTQFRFADEKEWGAETLTATQDASMFPDFQCLTKALQELPLHLRLNVEADLVQEEVPQELPQIILKSVSNIPKTFTIQKSVPAPEALTLEAEVLSEAKPSHDLGPPPLDEELDFLLNLDAPVRDDCKTFPLQIKEHDQQVTGEGPAVTSSSVDDAGLSAEEKPKSVTSEDLEDWLDSMIA